ncbi:MULTISPECIES: glucosyltransferase domain-containing protein [Enterobacterales]|uniref:glucosyltransferase domain-containing protein n=1 Tax=Enterobacterales TaxID=91347 RepID=UPI0011EE3A9F|nr:MULTISPECIES: glucosyltransferase domain-containing protein [Enterobacterales]KAA0260082.1 hypothetical protein ERL64_21120 [Hafnia alvei]MCH4627737.1 glucosyltransferase domain-containing protein [Escherichia coli]
MKINKPNASIYFFIVFSFLFYLPIVAPGVFYRDDIIRSIENFTGWGGLGGRPGGDYIWKILTLGDIAPIISPMTGIISILLLSYSVYFLYEKTCNYIGGCSKLIFLPLIISPFLLQNMSYQYDNIIMILPLSLCYISTGLLFRKNISSWVFYSISLFVSLSCYQMVINAYIVMLLFFMFVTFEKEGEINKKTIKYAFITYLSTAILYKFIIIDNFTPKSRSGHINTINELVGNISKSIDSIHSAIHGIQLYALIISFLISLVLILLIGVRKKLVMSLVILYISSLLFILGPVIFLTEGVTTPRQFMSFGSVVFFSLFASRYFVNVKYLYVLISIAYIYPSYLTSYKYSASLINQYNYENKMAFSIAMNLSEKINAKDTVYVQGFFKYTPQVKNIVNNDTFIKDMLQRNAWYPRMLISSFYSGNILNNWVLKYHDVEEIRNGKILYNSQDYLISNYKGRYYVVLK